ncbi:hypothetical protein V5H98_07365 [Georgenia sp. M64]|uniref:hypothetical protein n=1 Tax=Georgenia sp. M64 TaxID=3120520 RepID=UPI0030E2FD50
MRQSDSRGHLQQGLQGHTRSQLCAVLFGAIFFLTACSAPGAENDQVTEAEYRAAVQATADCMNEGGWEVGEVTENPDGVTYGFVITTEGDDAAASAAVDGAFSSCAASHLNEVESAYLSGLQLSGAERDAVYEQMITCLEAAGVTTVVLGDDESAVTSKIDAAIATGENAVSADDAWRCQQRYLLPLFGG